MPRPPRPSAPEQALAALELADESADPEEAAAHRQVATVHTLLAIAEQVAEVRERLADVSEALKGPNGHDAGTSLYYVSDWLEKIANRR